MNAANLRTEYLHEPVGLDVKNPRFFWTCEGGKEQTAYRIVATRDDCCIWDSGKIPSGKMTHIRYEGPELQSRDVVIWKVKLWDEHGYGGDWAASSFEMGLKPEDWKAEWITGSYHAKRGRRYPVDYFRKQFHAYGQVKKARLYATACGVYQIKVNDRTLRDFVLAPGMTDYRKHLQYQVYDVSLFLQSENTLEIALGDGWYRGSTSCFGVTNVYGLETKLLAQLEIEYLDGRRDCIVTDESFAWDNDGPLRFSDLRDGEVYDASKHPSYRFHARVTKTALVPTASNNVYVREKEQFKPRMLLASSGETVLDFGQNMAGYLAFAVKGHVGEKIRLIFGETLDETGKVDQSGFQAQRPVKDWNDILMNLTMLGMPVHYRTTPTPKQEIHFICSGNDDEYHTTFSVFGFRYVQVETTAEIDPDRFCAIAVYSDMDVTGRFDCSNALINKLVQNTLWSMKSNYLDLPTDCPTRERLGWTGDAQVFFNTGAYLMDTASFFKKWLRDMEDAQSKKGLLPSVFPYQGMRIIYDTTGGAVGWADAVYLIPYRFYQFYGDRELLESCYPMMRKYAQYMLKHTGLKDKKRGRATPYNSHLYEKGIHMGEWLEPEKYRDKVQGVKARFGEECTAYFFYTMKTMAEIAAVIGMAADAEFYTQEAEKIKEAYHAEYINQGSWNTDRQAKLVRPLALGLMDGRDSEKETLRQRLLQAVENNTYCVGTGFLSTPFLLGEITKAGGLEAAYKMLENEKKPSWLAEIKEGATTIWENWEGDASLNHYSMGAVCEWIFQSVGGITIAGENRFFLRPLPGGSLRYADVSYQSIYGTVRSSWKKENGRIRFLFFVPSNTHAEILLPDQQRYLVGSGIHQLEIPA